MGRTVSRIAFWLAGMALTGCAASPWASHKQVESKPAPAPAATAGGAAAAPAAQAQQSDAQAMQEALAELQKLGAIDPAAQEKLMADLRQTEPSLWPMVLAQARAAAAYRRQLEQQGAASPSANRPAGSQTSAPLVQSKPGSNSAAAAETYAAARPPDSSPATPLQSAAQAVSAAPPAPAAPAAPALLPAAEVARRVPLPSSQARPADPHVVPASYEAPVGADWRGQLAAAIRAMEAEAKGSPKGDGDPAMQERLRMLYLLAGRREDALQPIPSTPPALQDFWAKQLYGMGVWLDAERTPDVSRRAAETQRILSEALMRLGESSPLVVRNLAFCTEVQSYGALTPFKKSEFAPDQEVLLYVEVENFAAESTPKGFHTSLKSNYQVFDGRGQRVADHEFAPVEEFCQNARRDFYITYHLHIPKRVYPGKHTLQLTVEDLNSHKVGKSSIDFVVKGAEERD
jgi:hypothetical protein